MRYGLFACCAVLLLTAGCGGDASAPSDLALVVRDSSPSVTGLADGGLVAWQCYRACSEIAGDCNAACHAAASEAALSALTDYNGCVNDLCIAEGSCTGVVDFSSTCNGCRDRVFDANVAGTATLDECSIRWVGCKYN